MRIIMAGIVAGIVLFLWNAFSWLVLPWHNTVINQWSDETIVAETLKTQSPKSGIYFSPMKQAATPEEAAQSPLIFVSIEKSGVPASMALTMLWSLLSQIIAACLVSWMLFKTGNLGFFSCVGFVTVFGLAAGLVGHVPYMNWFGFNSYFTGLQLIDLIVGWYFAGVVIAFFYRAARARTR